MSNIYNQDEKIRLYDHHMSPPKPRSSAFESIWNTTSSQIGAVDKTRMNGSNLGGNRLSLGNIWGSGYGGPHDVGSGVSTGLANPETVVRNGALEDLRSYNFEDLASMDLEARRHSYGEIMQPGTLAGYGSTSYTLSQPVTYSALPSGRNNSFQDRNMELVNEYFERDPHQRVRVTESLLARVYAAEKDLLNACVQFPNFVTDQSIQKGRLALVAFKAGRIDVFHIPPGDLDNLKVGSLVIVEADRGRDLGKICKLDIPLEEARMMKLLQAREQQAALSEIDSNSDLSISEFSKSGTSGIANSFHYPKAIIGLAQPGDIIQILNKSQDEEKACRLCWAKISSTTSASINQEMPTSPRSSVSMDLLQLRLIDAEYQFDRKKLIFYYSTHKRIDFRDLVRELFRIYKTRIWMCAVIGIPYNPQIDSRKQDNSPTMKRPSFEQMAPPNPHFGVNQVSHMGIRSNSLQEQQLPGFSVQSNIVSPGQTSSSVGTKSSSGYQGLRDFLNSEGQAPVTSPNMLGRFEEGDRNRNLYPSVPFLSDPFNPSGDFGRETLMADSLQESATVYSHGHGPTSPRKSDGSVPAKFLG